MIALFFGIVYPLFFLIIACVGSFKIATRKEERTEEAQSGRGSYYTFKYNYNELLWKEIWLVVALSTLWPIAIPLCFSWYAGHHLTTGKAKP